MNRATLGSSPPDTTPGGDSPLNATTEAPSNAKSFSILMLIVATIAIAGACFLTNPPAFSEAHHQDGSVLKTVVSLLGLAGSDGDASAYPTLRGLEIRSLCFHVGAAALMLAFGVQLLTSGARPRMTSDDLLDIKRHFTGPFAWWALFLFVSVVSSYFSRAPDIALGGVLLRILAFGWWLPLAVALRPMEAKRLTATMTLLISLMALLGIWYYHGRPGMNDRLRYPVGNELWFAACLLPAIFIAAGGVLAGLQRGAKTDGGSGQRIDLIVMSFAAMIICAYALWLTKSRSAAAGMYAGGCFAIILLAPKKTRALTLLASILIALAAVRSVVLPMLQQSAMGDRAHSVRSRLNHEWPYALTLWFQKPVGGHGEGGYTMLAGQFARDDQLLDPNAIAIDEQVWVVEAHNEYLNLLADVGLAGTIGFVGALVITLFWAFRYADRRRDDPNEGVNRCIVIGLAAALVAVAFEEGATVGLRHPGLPPLFYTTWACLWVMVRSERPAPKRRASEAEIDERRLSASTVRLGGVVAALIAVALAFVGIQDWRASRAQFETNQAMAEGDFTHAIELADFSGSRLLDPMRKLISRRFAIEARVGELVRRLQFAVQNQQTPGDDVMQLAQATQVEVNALQNIAPRFLGISKLQWQLALARRDAHWLRKEEPEAREFHADYLEWLNRNRADEPFNLEYLFRLWNEVNEAEPAMRFDWLRVWLRRNQIGADPRFGLLLQSLATQVPGFKPALEDAVNVAKQDAEKPMDEWQDAFSPETLRIAAAVAEMTGKPDTSVEYAGIAADMYAKAGGRLFTAESAALMEKVSYAFHSNPAGDPTPLLKEIVRAREIREGPLAETGDAALDVPLTHEFGQLRIAVLLGAGREADAKRQIEALLSDEATGSIETRLAISYARLANRFAGMPRFAAEVTHWADRAEALDPQVLDATFARLRLALARGNDDAALAAAKHMIEAGPDRRESFAALAQAEYEKPESGIWKVLRKRYDDYPPLPQATRQPTTQPTTIVPGVPDVSERPARDSAVERLPPDDAPATTSTSGGN